jgi:hypothetical protein
MSSADVHTNSQPAKPARQSIRNPEGSADMLYNWVKAAHLIFVIATMASLMIYPRYKIHQLASQPGERDDEVCCQQAAPDPFDHPEMR